MKSGSLGTWESEWGRGLGCFGDRIGIRDGNFGDGIRDGNIGGGIRDGNNANNKGDTIIIIVKVLDVWNRNFIVLGLSQQRHPVGCFEVRVRNS